MGHSRKIVILDRDDQICEYLTTFIPLLGECEITRAHSAIDFLAKLNAFEPELLVYELNPLYAHARDILRETRKKHPRTHIIVMLPNAKEETSLREEGFHDILLKPVDLTDLSQRIKKALPMEEVAPATQEVARLLVVDDEPGISWFLGENFKQLGLEVHTATDGKEALDLFKKKVCNLAIVDIRMPHITGDELIKLFQESTDPPTPKAIIIITACLGDPSYDLKRLGYPVIEKPMNVKVLEDLILDACQKYNLTLHTS